MFRIITALVLLLAFATQTFERTFLILDYYSNKAVFAKNCENKLRPMLHCNGQCVLAKKIKEQESKEQGSSERKLQNKSDLTADSLPDTFAGISLAEPQSIHFESAAGAALLRRPYSIFHPPCI